MIKTGIGMACMIYPMDPANKSSSTGVFVKMNSDGTVVIYNGQTDLGQGSNTALMQIAAETLCIPIGNIRFITSDTEITPYDEGTGASRNTYIIGNAIKEACEQVTRVLFKAAAKHFGFADPSKFYLDEGMIYLDTFPSVCLSVREAAYISERDHGFPVLGMATFGTLSTVEDPKNGQVRNFEKHIFATQMAEIELDTETGFIKVTKLIAVHDCGTAVNPMLLEGQIQGGVMQGIGYTFMEEMIESHETGRLLNNNFTDYHLPTTMDVPLKLIVDYVEIPDKDGAYGALGVSEPTPGPVAPAIANAVYDAVGVRILELPLTPERVLRALKEKGI